MVTGTALGQSASIVLAPVLTRLYTPDQFGYLSVYTAALTIFGVIAVLGFELAIPIAASELEVANLLAISAATLTAMTGIIALAVGLLPDQALQFSGSASWHRTGYLLPFGFACLGGYYVMVAAATRAGAFRDIAATRIIAGSERPAVADRVRPAGRRARPASRSAYVIGQSSGTFLLFSRVILRSPGIRRRSHGAA